MTPALQNLVGVAIAQVQKHSLQKGCSRVALV